MSEEVYPHEQVSDMTIRTHMALEFMKILIPDSGSQDYSTLAREALRATDALINELNK